MTSAILQSVAAGYSARQILQNVAKSHPQYANKINTALAAGYTADTVLQHISENGKTHDKSSDRYLTELEQVKKRDVQQKRRAALQLVGALGTAGAIGAGLYGYSQLGKAVQPSQILPARMNPPSAPQAGATINVNPIRPGGGAITGRAPQAQLPYNPQKPPAQTNVQAQPPSVPQAPKTPQHRDISRNVALVDNLKEDARIGNFLRQGLDIATVAALVRKTAPKSKVDLMERAEGGLEQLISDYSQHVQDNPPTTRSQQMPPQQQSQNFPVQTQEQLKQEQIYPQEQMREQKPISQEQVQETQQKELAPIQEIESELGSEVEDKKLTKLESVKVKKKYSLEEADEIFPKEFFYGLKKDDVSHLSKKWSDDAANEIVERIANGENFATSFGKEWKSVGFKDVTDMGKLEFPKSKAQEGISFTDIIFKHFPVRGIYNSIYSTKEEKRNNPISKFEKKIEKEIIEKVIEKQNPEEYHNKEYTQNKRLDELLSKNVNQLNYDPNDEDFIKEIDEILFGKKTKKYEEEINKKIKSIR